MSDSCPGAVQHRGMDIGLVCKSLMKKMDVKSRLIVLYAEGMLVSKPSVISRNQLAMRGDSLQDQVSKCQSIRIQKMQSVHEGCCVSSHVLTGHLYVLCGEMSIQVLCPFSNWIFCLFVVELQEFVDIFWILNSCQINVFQIFYFILCIVFPLTMSFDVQKFFILMSSN